MNKKAVHSKSFAQNMFRGILEPEQVFPYPKVIRFLVHHSFPESMQLQYRYRY
jgi:hypothetical protein